MELIRRDTGAWPDSVNNFTTIKFGDLELIKRLGCLELEIELEDDSPASKRPGYQPFPDYG
ncbi:hypothetical protein MPER_00621 [Moniliophthora perniciosa FA553]|nr:hypothetical protein MPER_00621 [Moniliophthora perniciosa FA553]